jgi:hypothetical protein
MRTLIILLLFVSSQAFGQGRVNITNDDVNLQLGGFFQAVSGVPVVTGRYYKVVEGSPFFSEHWMKGSAALDKDKEYHNLTLRVNLLEDKVHFMDVKGNEIICTTPINRMTVKDSLTGRIYHFMHSSFIPAATELKEPAWLEVMSDGRAQLVCLHKKTVTETRPYGSATMEQRIVTSDLYYLHLDGRFVRVKKPQDVAAELKGKEKEAQQWLRTNSDKGVAALTKLVDWYNAQSN